MLLNQINWNKINGLLPVIVQDEISNEVLMMAYMNEEALKLSMDTKIAHYFSRTKNRLWKKGETSGNIQIIKDAYLDCDYDTLLLKVKQEGVACHTGRKSCFFNKINTNEVVGEIHHKSIANYSIIDTLFHTISHNIKNANPSTSYVAKHSSQGENSILKKICEEACELTLACKDKNKKEIIHESADLLFHTLIALSYNEIHPDNIKSELKRRQGISGIEEKKNRK